MARTGAKKNPPPLAVVLVPLADRPQQAGRRCPHNYAIPRACSLATKVGRAATRTHTHTLNDTHHGDAAACPCPCSFGDEQTNRFACRYLRRKVCGNSLIAVPLCEGTNAFLSCALFTSSGARTCASSTPGKSGRQDRGRCKIF